MARPLTRASSAFAALSSVVMLCAMMAACAAGAGSAEGDSSAASGASSGGVGGAAGAGGSALGGMGGSEPECELPADCPGMDSTCSMRSCTAGECGVELAPEGTDCGDDDGNFCDGQGACVECVEGGQCDSGVCADGVCAEPSCDDTVLNGLETDVDCGGSECPSCADGEMCVLASDCASLYCDDTQSPAVCSPCVFSSDCAGAPGTYCDMGACVPQKGNGFPCSAPEQCSSGFCPIEDGVCCDGACDLSCESCLGASNMLGDGTCGPTLACVGGDQCCPAGCTDVNDADCALQDLGIGSHGSLYSSASATRGFWFTAPVAFTIFELRVPTAAGFGQQNFQVVRFNSGPPPTYPGVTTNFTTLHYSVGIPGTGYIQVNIPVDAGDVIGVLGARGSSQLAMSYSTANTINTNIFGQPVTLNRLVYQANMVTTPAGPLSYETGGPIGRVELKYGY